MYEHQPFLDLFNQFFDKIYVITLRRAADRQEHIESELTGLNYSFFYGKDKQDFTIEDLAKNGIYNEQLARKHHRYGRPMPRGKLGCSWSHKLVYEDVLAHGYKRVLILEDDVRLDKEKIHLLPYILNELPQDWELLYFGYTSNEIPPKGTFIKKLFYHLLRATGFFKFSHKTIKNLYPQKSTQHIYKAGYHDCTHAYAITLSAAEKLKNLQEPITFVADSLLAYAATNEILNAYITIPKLINQQNQVADLLTYSYINE